MTFFAHVIRALVPPLFLRLVFLLSRDKLCYWFFDISSIMYCIICVKVYSSPYPVDTSAIYFTQTRA